MNTRELIIFGKKTDAVSPGNDIYGTYELAGANRDQVNPLKLPLDNDKHLLEITFDDGGRPLTWTCDPSTLHELFPELDPATMPPGKRSGETAALVLPEGLTASGAERGIIGNLVAKVLRIIAKTEIKGGVARKARELEDKHLMNGVDENLKIGTKFIKNKLTDEGEEGAAIFRLDPNFYFHPFTFPDVKQPYFLFIHGTNSDTYGAFCQLKDTAVWKSLHNIYPDRVLAFQHRTLTRSPLANAVSLATMLPDGATLHIMSHSRGGIVGDILSKYSSDNTNPPGFSEENIRLLANERGDMNDADILNIKKLNKIFNDKKIKVEKFIRVACPAAGTVLASRRLDHMFNIFFNLASYGLPVFGPLLKELVAETVKSKEDTSVLPGVEAQRPDSPFIKILNDQSPKMAINGQPLVVISGNGTASFSGKGLLILLARLFYTQRNDLVVNTDSMYLGAKRNGEFQYFFDEGADVNHVKYFENQKTRDAINIIVNTPADEPMPGFKQSAQDAVPQADRDLRGLEYGELEPNPEMPTGNRPIAILLPGIMGSNLKKKGSKIWLNYLSALFGGLTKMAYANDKTVKATSLIKTSYAKLASRLQNNYDVIVYPFDWRKPLDESAAEFNATINRLLAYGQPIKIIGHSMGGVLVRDFIVNHEDTWNRLNQSKDFRLLFLGSPLKGSHRILTVLFGQDTIINSLNTLDRVNSKKELLSMFSKFPGILNLLPLSTGGENDREDFALPKTWKSMCEVLGDNQWPIPDAADLKAFGAYRDKALQKLKTLDYSNMVYIAGQDKATPCDYFNDNIPPRRELVFLYTAEGDQSVTWESGIPAQMIEKNAVYYVPYSHGALANTPEIFSGIEDILGKGSTDQLSTSRPKTRGDAKRFRAAPVYSFDFTERGLENAIMGTEDKRVPVASEVPLSVSVSNGDLKYANYPVLAGHFLNDSILYAEDVIDRYMDSDLKNKHRLNLYPGAIGTNELFLTPPEKDSEFPGAIIVGLGEPENLSSHELASTVEQGILNYLLRIRETPASTRPVGISTLIIGCGYGGLSIENSVKAIVEGIQMANSRARELFKNNCKTIQHAEFIELYKDRALNCIYALKNIVQQENDMYHITLRSKSIRQLPGAKSRLPVDTTAEWWNRITVNVKKPKDADKEPTEFYFGTATSDARVEENQLYSSTPLIDLFIAEASLQNNWNDCTAKTLFELMIPNGQKERLKRKGNITWVLDNTTAGYPWELLQDSTANAKPLSVNAGMIRQLATSDYRINIKRVAEAQALIIADPDLENPLMQLPGALAEGDKVKSMLDKVGYPNKMLPRARGADIVKSLFCEDYTIIHLAGHGVFDPASPRKSGMVIGKDVFLTVFDIAQMPVTPELVFVNCCHLGRTDDKEEKYFRDRYKLAANIGTELIRIGVKAVIAAGWAVNDAAALEFSRVFYESMFKGDAFGEAVKKARYAIYQPNIRDNTWGAYQCYGDPYYKFKRTWLDQKETPLSYFMPEEAIVDYENLRAKLEVGNYNLKDSMKKLEKISKAVETAGFKDQPALMEEQALLYYDMAEYARAEACFKSMKDNNNADFTVTSIENYCTVRTKNCIQELLKSSSEVIDLDKTRSRMNAVINDIQRLFNVAETSERFRLMGSTYKYQSMLLADRAARRAALLQAAYYFDESCKKAEKAGQSEIDILDKKVNKMLVEYMLVKNGFAGWGQQVQNGKNKYKLSRLADLLATLKTEKSRFEKMAVGDGNEDPDYWEMVSCLNISVCDIVLRNQVPAKEDIKSLVATFRKIWRRAGCPRKRMSEFDQLQFIQVALMQAAGKPVSGLDIIDNIDSEDCLVTLENILNSIVKLNRGAGKPESPAGKKSGSRLKKAAPKKAAPKKAVPKKAAVKKAPAKSKRVVKRKRS